MFFLRMNAGKSPRSVRYIIFFHIFVPDRDDIAKSYMILYPKGMNIAL